MPPKAIDSTSTVFGFGLLGNPGSTLTANYDPDKGPAFGSGFDPNRSHVSVSLFKFDPKYGICFAPAVAISILLEITAAGLFLGNTL